MTVRKVRVKKRVETSELSLQACKQSGFSIRVNNLERVERSELPLQVCKQSGVSMIQSLELVDSQQKVQFLFYEKKILETSKR